MRAYAATDVGRCREINQDYVFCSVEPVGGLPNLFVVADGMGGHRAGDLASRYTVEGIIDDIREAQSNNPINVISDAISKANSRLISKSKESDAYYGMGTTIVLCTVIDKTIYVANVGDSRLYIYDGKLQQITRDHSLVEEMISLGKINRSEARTHEKKNIITRAVGAYDEIVADFFEADLKSGNMIIMCSDGLTNMVDDFELEKILNKDITIKEKVKELIDAANENGGRDNIAVVIIEL